MPVNILMPALSPTMEKGNLSKWLKKEGDKVKAGDVIAEIETDKATMEYESIDDGVLAKIVVPEGTQDVTVNQLIAVLAQEGEDPKAAAAAAGKGAAAAPAKPAESQARPAEPAARPASAAPPSPQPSPQRGEGAAPGLRNVRRPRHRLSQREARVDQARANGQATRVFASPLARRLAKDVGIDLARIQGSGPHGRIVARDVEAAKSGKGKFGTARRSGSSACRSRRPPTTRSWRCSSRAASSSCRTTICARSSRSDWSRPRSTIPHFYLTVDCHVGKLLAAREEINAAAPKDKDGKPAYKLSVNDFVIKALALALQRVPDANVTWTEAAMIQHKHSDIGVAVAIPGGLITPIIRKAEAKSLSAISAEMKDFERPRARAQARSPMNIRAAAARCRISACSASRISPP